MRRLLALLFALLPAPAVADAMIDNVNGLTLDDHGQVVHFNAILLSADGHVTQLLAPRDKRPKKVEWRIDEDGRTLLPGMVAADAQVMALGFQAFELDLSAASSLADAQDRIRAYAASNPDKKWIIGRGWNVDRLGLGRFPTAAELDAAVSDRPVWLTSADGHAAWGNSAALTAAGMSAHTASPPGGRIEKAASGEPAGVFVDAARQLVERVVPQPLPKERDAAFLQAQQQLLSHGYTAVADMGTSIDDWLAYRRAGDRDALRIRIMSYAGSVEAAIAIGGTGPTPWLYGDRLRMGGVSLETDGALASRGAWLMKPYADAAGQRGDSFMTDDQLQNRMSRAAMDGYQLAVAATGDRAVQQALDAVDTLSDTYKGDRRWRIEGARVIDAADLPRLAAHGAIAVMPAGAGDWPTVETRLGTDRLGEVDRWASVLHAGGRLALASGSAGTAPDPWAGWAAAVTRTDAAGQPFGGWQPQERLAREQAWQALTVGAATAGFAEQVFGRLAPGQRADFIIVDRDPLLAGATELRQTQVEETWVGGQKVWARQR